MALARFLGLVLPPPRAGAVVDVVKERVIGQEVIPERCAPGDVHATKAAHLTASRAMLG